MSYRARRGAVLVLVTLLGCASMEDMSTEVSRTADPTGRVDAVLLEGDGGATTSYLYRVYVVPHGARVVFDSYAAELIGATRSDSAWGVNLRWAGPGLLRVEYLKAKYAEMPGASTVVGSDSVRVVLADSISDVSAPSGGMDWNRRGRPQPTQPSVVQRPNEALQPTGALGASR